MDYAFKQAKYVFLEERETKLKALQLALVEGEKSGIADYSLEKLSAELDS